MADEVKPLEVINLSGQKVDPKEWEKGDKQLAISVCCFLYNERATSCISTTDDGALIIDYAIGGQIWPSIRIYGGRIVWPKGSPHNLVMKFLGMRE